MDSATLKLMASTSFSVPALDQVRLVLDQAEALLSAIYNILISQYIDSVATLCQ